MQIAGSALLSRAKRWLLNPRPRKFLSNFADPLFWVLLCVGHLVSVKLAGLPLFEFGSLHITNDIIRRVAEERLERAENVWLLTIDQSSFEKDFGGRRPLPAEQVETTVCLALQQNPAVLVVDVDTSDTAFANLHLPSSEIPIVWARGVETPVGAKLGAPVATTEVASAPILGGQQDLPAGHFSGLAAFTLALDRSIRTYDRVLPVAGVGPRNTLHHEAVCRFCDQYADKCANVRCDVESVPEPIRAPILDKYFEPTIYLVGDLLAQSSPEQFDRCRGAWSAAPIRRRGTGEFTGKIVILGGDYSNNDRHSSIFGEKPGMWLVAAAIEHELSATPHPLPEWLGHAPIEVSVVLSVLAVHTWLRPLAALFVTSSLLASFVYFGGWLAFYYGNYHISVVPLLIAIVVEQLTMSAEHAAHDADKLEAIEAALDARSNAAAVGHPGEDPPPSTAGSIED